MSFDILLKIHLFSVAFWFGILGAELIIERNRTLSALHSKAVAHQHFWIDMLFETPAFVIVLITGLLMINPQQTDLFYWAKVAFGLIAVGGNILCTIAIVKRKLASDDDNRADVIRHSKFVDKLSAVAAPAGVLALLLAAFAI
mgnify:CR=1 FL=1